MFLLVPVYVGWGLKQVLLHAVPPTVPSVPLIFFFFLFRIQARSRLGAWPWYNTDADEGEEGVSGGEGGVSQKKYRFSKATFSERFIGRARRRRGRGGRWVWLKT